MCFGTAGSILPGIPGTPVVVLAAIAHRLYFGAASASNTVLAIIVLLMVLSLVMDYLASMAGAKKLGATWRGVLGAIIGALVFEMIGGSEWKRAARAGLGAVLGLFVGALGKVACCVAMAGLFAVNVIVRSI